MISSATRWMIFAVLATAMTVLAGCGGGVPASVAPPPPPEVTVSKPEVREVTDYFEFPGQTAAVGEVEVRARVTGYLMKVGFEDGKSVKKGDLLYEIDPRPYQDDLGPRERRSGAIASARRKGQDRRGSQRTPASVRRRQPRRV